MLSNSGMKAGNESQACSYIRGGEDGDSVATLASIRQHRNKTYISQLGVGREHPNQEVSPPPPVMNPNQEGVSGMTELLQATWVHSEQPHVCELLRAGREVYLHCKPAS